MADPIRNLQTPYSQYPCSSHLGLLRPAEVSTEAGSSIHRVKALFQVFPNRTKQHWDCCSVRSRACASGSWPTAKIRADPSLLIHHSTSVAHCVIGFRPHMCTIHCNRYQPGGRTGRPNGIGGAGADSTASPYSSQHQRSERFHRSCNQQPYARKRYHTVILRFRTKSSMNPPPDQHSP